MVPTMNSKEILWPDKQLTDQIQKAKEIQRRTLSRRPLWSRRPQAVAGDLFSL